MCDGIANGGPRYYAPPPVPCPPANVIIASNVLSTNGNVIAGNVISQDGTFTGNLYVSGQIVSNLTYNQLNVYGIINAVSFSGDGYGLVNLNASSLTGTISPTTLPPSGVTAGLYGDYSNVSRVEIDTYGRVVSAANVAILSSQWTTVAGNVAYKNGVSIGTLSEPPPGSNLLVLGTANIDTINVNTLFANSAIVFGSKTLNVLGISNLFFVSGDGGGMSNIRGSSISGNVANANVALVVSQAAQPNITSVGVLTSLTIIGSLSAGTISGSGQGIYGIPGSAITDTVSTANSIVLASQPNITSVGTLTGLKIQGLLVASNASGISNINASNISLGTLSPSILPASGVTSGLYGSGANVSSVTVDTYGRVVSASNIAITASQWTGAIGGPLYYQNFVGVGSTATPTATMQVTGNVYASNAITTQNIFFSNKIQDVNLPASGVTAGGYGSSANIPTLVVDTYGRIVSGSNTSVIGSQWTSVSANVAFGNGVSIGTLSNPPTGSNLYVLGLATISNISSNGAALSAIQASNIVGNVANANVALVVSQPAQPNITSLGTLTGLYSSGNITGTFFTGGGNALSNIQSSVLVGNVANANVALVVSQPAQPNITSLGTLTGLYSSGNITGTFFTGGGNALSNIQSSVLVGNVANANVALVVSQPAQPNITSVGTTATVFTVNGLLIAANASGLSNINSSNLVGNVANANVALVVSQPAQPNITSVGTTATVFTVNGLLIAANASGLSNINSSNLVGNVANANVALVVSQPAQPNITSVGTTSTVFTVNGLLIAANASGLSNINSSNLVGNVANANVALVVSQPAQPNITSLGTLTGLYSSGNITGTFFSGGGNALSNIQSSSLVGNVANANVALVVSQAAQPNITSVSTAGKTFTINGLLIAGNASGLSNINSSNLVGNVANANVALVVSQPAQPNITSLGTLTGLYATGNLTAAFFSGGGNALSNIQSSSLVGNVANANVALVVSQPAQPNITSVGTTATVFTVNGLLIAANASGLSNINSSNLVGNVANANVALVVSQASQPNITSVGTTATVFTVNGLLIAANASGLSNINSSNLVGNVANANVALVVSQPVQPNITSVSTAGKTFTINGLLIAGNASGLSNINSSNLVGNVANANVALVVSQPAQPNITSLGTLTGIYATGNLTATFFSGGGNALSNIQSSSLVGNVANANVALVVSQPAQPNITSVGTTSTVFTVNGLLIAANASGLSNINSSNLVGNVANANVALVVSQPAQPNITSVGTTATVFTVNGLLVASNASGLSNINSSNLVGNVANANVALVVSQAAQPNITSVGTLSNLVVSNSVTTSNLVSNLINIFTTSNLANVVTNDLTVPGSMRANLTNTTFFFNTLTIPFISATTLNVSSTSNLDTLTLTGEPGITTLYAVGNIFSTNSFSTTNVLATTANIPTIFASNSLTTGNVFVSNGLDVGPGTLGTNVVVFSNISGGANAFVMDSNGRVTIGSTYRGGSLLSFGQPTLNKIISLFDGNNADNPATATNFYGFGISGYTLRYQTNDTLASHIFYGATSEYARITNTGVSILTGAAPTANLHVKGNVYVSNALQTTNVVTSNINVSYTANISNLVVTSNILPGPSGSTYLTGNLVVSGNVFTSLGTPLGDGGSLYYSLASNYKPPVYTGVLYGQALALSLTPFNEQGSSTLVSRSANGNFKFNKTGIYNIKAVFLTTQDNIIGMGIGSNVSDTTTRTDQTYVYSYTTFITKNPTETLDIQFYVGSTTAYYYIDIYAIDSPTLMPTSDPIGGTWLSIGPFQGGGGSGPPVTISTLGAVVTGRTTSYGAGVGDYYIGMSNGQTVNLPIGSSLTAGKQYIIKDESGLAGTFVGYRVTVAASSPNLIDGQTSLVIALNYGAVNVIWTGSFWSIY